MTRFSVCWVPTHHGANRCRARPAACYGTPLAGFVKHIHVHKVTLRACALSLSLCCGGRSTCEFRYASNKLQNDPLIEQKLIVGPYCGSEYNACMCTKLRFVRVRRSFCSRNRVGRRLCFVHPARIGKYAACPTDPPVDSCDRAKDSNTISKIVADFRS
jgi:hypothetical protein